MKISNGQDVNVKELTVKEIRECLKALSVQPEVFDVLGEFAHPDLTFREIELFTDMDNEQIDSLTSNDLNNVVSAILKKNVHWVDTRKKIMETAAKLNETKKG